ncbi:MAG: glycosyltransferase family 4 protein [Parcubacteria group bacterium]
MRIFVTSYTYIYEHNYHIFDYFKDKKKLFFVLPKEWKSTKGDKQTYYPTLSDEFEQVKASAYFYHSNYPVLRGQLKGWIPSLGRILRKHAKKGDVLYSAYEPNLLVTYLYARLARKLGLKHVFSTWQNVPYDSRMSGFKLKIIKWLVKRNIELSTAGLFGTERAREIHESYLKHNPELKTSIIPQTGVDTDVFKPDIESDFREKYAKNADCVFLFASTFTERKGPIPTLHAFKRVVKRRPDTHLIMVGIGELHDEMKEFVEKSGISDNVTFLPWQPINQLAPIFANSDVLIHPSQPYQGWEEQFGLLMLQAQACETPVIATRSGSLEETVLDTKTGILVEPGSVDEIEQAMDRLAGDVAFRRELGHNARQYIIEHFSRRSVGERLERFLTSI